MDNEEICTRRRHSNLTPTRQTSSAPPTVGAPAFNLHINLHALRPPPNPPPPHNPRGRVNEQMCTLRAELDYKCINVEQILTGKEQSEIDTIYANMYACSGKNVPTFRFKMNSVQSEPRNCQWFSYERHTDEHDLRTPCTTHNTHTILPVHIHVLF
jgi:hypothetical protein